MNEDEYIDQLKQFGHFEFEGIPRHMIGGIARWLLNGIEGGSFLMAVFNTALWAFMFLATGVV